jgi:propionyl-CoA carboxylase alpha chain
MIQRLLVANRGEIASRVFATCRRLGIETVAVHSDADAMLPYVREADAAVRLPGNAPTDTYLDIDLVLDAAKRTGADAIHPGYGFLSENADFARAVEDAGLTWIGPTPKSIEAMGSKIEAKRIMAEAGVPVLEAPERPTDANLPLIVKASAGGGGRGMRVVRAIADLDAEIEKARNEAESAFGDGTVFVEPYVEHGRHVEVQVVGDEFGNVSVFGERDCSIQRRHQKVVEEAPAPRLPDQTRRALHEAARAAAAAIEYRGAGTVEFLYDADADRFFFLEMNTRLQVEHPVTEAVFGVDLVELQLGVAEHEKLPVLIEDRAASGHAIEVRLYAEDPAADHAPQSGELTLFEIAEGPGVRVDAGYASGSTVSTFYDAMLAKVICHAPTRERAARQLAGALTRARIHGVTTNRDQLVAILTDPGFLAGEVNTAFLAQSTLSERRQEPHRTALVAAALMLAEDDADRRTVQRGIPVGWRNVVSQPQRTDFEGHPPVEWVGGRDGYLVDGIAVLEASSTRVRLEVDGVALEMHGHISRQSRSGTREVHLDGPMPSVSLREVPRFVDPADAVASGSLLAHMPGTVVRVAVEPGDRVEAGQTVLVLEAMKMQHTVAAPHAGTVTELSVRPGDQVAAGEVLAVVSTGSTDGSSEEESR